MILARRRQTDAQPMDRKDGPLVLEECTGTFWLVEDQLAKQLMELDCRIVSLFDVINHKDRKPSNYDLEAASYLRQLVDHFLCSLHKSDKVGNHKHPLELRAVDVGDEVHNALKNMKGDKPWDTGVQRDARDAAGCSRRNKARVGSTDGVWNGRSLRGPKRERRSASSASEGGREGQDRAHVSDSPP